MKPLRIPLVASFLLGSFSLGHGEAESFHFPSDCRDNDAPEQEIEAKIRQIEISGMNLFQAPLTEVMNTLSAKSRQNDFTESDPAAKGVKIITMLEGKPPPKVTAKLNRMSLDKMLDFITEMVGWRYDVREDVIVVSKEARGGGGVPRGLKVEFFEVPQGIIQRMTGVGGGGPPDPFGGGAAKPLDQAGKVKQYLAHAGVRFDERKGHRFAFDGFQIIATHEQESLDRIRAILLSLDDQAARQIEAQFKILETPLGALDKALEKALGQRFDKGTKAIQIENRLADLAFNELNQLEGVEVKSLPRLVVMDGQPASMKIGEEMIYPTDFKSPNPAANATDRNKTGGLVPQFDTVAPDDEQPGFRQIGTRIDLTPRYEPQYDRVNLELAPKITEFKGFEEYGSAIKVPKFWSWTLNTSVTLQRNHTMIFRGPASDEKREIIIFLQANAVR